MRMVQRSLNHVDLRLVDHGSRVARMVDAMLRVEDTLSEQDRRAVYFLTLFHDIGIYHADEISSMLSRQDADLWEHCLYGYLFLRELPFLSDHAAIILYHHLPYNRFRDQDPHIAHLAQIIHVADRADVFLSSDDAPSALDLSAYLNAHSTTLFAPDAVALLLEAQRSERPNPCTAAAPSTPSTASIADASGAYTIPEREAKSCLKMLINAIDFRSYHTVTHTFTTAHISYQLALFMHMPASDQEQIYHAALLHDLGKIGIPLEILEKPGKLTAAERTTMETHVNITEAIITGCVDDEIAAIALRHHEKLDGSGYPYHLAAADLSPAQRLVAIADIASALSGKRSYKDPFPKQRVLEIINRMKDQRSLDAEICICLEENYDAIRRAVNEACVPILATHDHLQSEYARLLPLVKAYFK
ncbi:MAG: HD domain-containing protein [Raoultibacter sp.]